MPSLSVMPSEEIPSRKLDLRLAEIPPEIQMALGDEATEIAIEAWSLLKAGYDRFTISRQRL